MNKVLLAFLLAVSGCATVYQGPLPNLSLRGAEAEKEYQQFKMVDSSGQGFSMGPEKSLYTRDSLNPVFAAVSPRAMEKLENADHWKTAEDISLGVAGAALIALITSSNSDTQHVFLISTLSADAVSIICGMVRWGELSTAQKMYNADLRDKLGVKAPKMAAAMSFSVMKF